MAALQRRRSLSQSGVPTTPMITLEELVQGSIQFDMQLYHLSQLLGALDATLFTFVSGNGGVAGAQQLQQQQQPTETCGWLGVPGKRTAFVEG